MNKPKIRFKGYADDWEKRKLGEIGTTYTGLTGKTKEDFGHGDGHFVTYMNIFLNSVASPDMVESVEIDERQNKVLAGDVLFTTSSETPEEVGMSSVWLENSDNTYLNSFCFGYRPSIPFDSYYLAYMLRSSSMRKKITFLAQGISRYNISKNKMMDIEISVPTICEQQQVGGCFRYLDHLITLHQRKCEETKTLKKYMLQKMFPQNGTNVPEIRFGGFTDAWEQRKLGDICESFEYGLNAAAKEYDGKNKYIRITDIDDSSHEFLQENVTSPDMDLTGAENYCLKYGDILFARTGASVGKTYIYKDSDGLVYYAGFLIRGRVKDEFAPEFVYQNTLTDDYEKFIRITSQRSGQPGVNAQEYAGYEISMPTYKEQNKIGQYFSNLDYLITLHQHKCEELRNIKKFMMQNMFV